MNDRRPTQVELRRVARWIAWGGVLTFVFALLSREERAAPTGDAVRVAVVGLAVALAAAAVPRLVAGRSAHARLTRAVRAAAARLPRALEQGLPGTAGPFAVARGQGRIALLHVRPARDDGQRGELEVRTVATRSVADDDLDAVTAFCSIASNANLRSRGLRAPPGASARSPRGSPRAAPASRRCCASRSPGSPRSSSGHRSRRRQADGGGHLARAGRGPAGDRVLVGAGRGPPRAGRRPPRPRPVLAGRIGSRP